VIYRFVLFASAFLLTGCTNFQQYVYNCTASPMRFSTGLNVGPKGYFGRRTGLQPFTVNDYALFPDGTYKAPIRVAQEQVKGSERGNTWVQPANVCAQFDGQVVIVDLK